MPKKRGKLIVIEGTDGSGKGTQLKLLVAALRRTGRQVVTLDFPQYGRKSAYFVEQYLNGNYGKHLSPYIASLFYSLDRYAAKNKLDKWLKQGRVVVVNRFTLSNAAHQGGKISGSAALKKYWQWLFDLEFKTLGLAKPDVTVLLHMPSAVAYKLVLKKKPRRYLKLRVKQDIHEADMNHLRKAEARYLSLAKLVRAKVIRCVVDGRLLTPKEINRRILNLIKL
jgi:dTMP kinase